MPIREEMPRLIRVYLTDKPRTLGLFHANAAHVEGRAKQMQNVIGTIMHVGPCKCGDPTHTFPKWYSMTPCVFVHAGGMLFTVRIPWWMFNAIQWFTGPSQVQP